MSYQEDILWADPVPVHVADGQPLCRLLRLLCIRIQLTPLVKGPTFLLLLRGGLVRAGVGVEIGLAAGIVHSLVPQLNLEKTIFYKLSNFRSTTSAINKVKLITFILSKIPYNL